MILFGKEKEAERYILDRDSILKQEQPITKSDIKVNKNEQDQSINIKIIQVTNDEDIIVRMEEPDNEVSMLMRLKKTEEIRN